MFASYPAWRPPAYDETDVSDKPLWVQQLPSIDPTVAATADALHRKQLETLQALDRAVGSILDTLAKVGRQSNTIMVYTSDNGFSWGEHRWLDNKNCVYEECVRVPLWVSVPGVPGRTDDHLVQNIDLAPSVLEWAGVTPPAPLNGLSLAPLINDPLYPWRAEILLEWLGNSSSTVDFSAVRTPQHLYAEYGNGDRELYDLVADPSQLTNVINDSALVDLIPALQGSLAALKAQ